MGKIKLDEVGPEKLYFCIKTCRVPRPPVSWSSLSALQWQVYSQLFCASELTHWTQVVYDSEWVTAALHSAFWPMKWRTQSSYSAVWLLHGWCHVSEAAVAWVHSPLCTPCKHAPVYSVTLIRKEHVYLSVTCHLHFWQNDRDLLRAAAVTRWSNGYRKKGSAQKIDLGEENSPAVPAGTGTRDLLIMSLALRYHWAIPVPQIRPSLIPGSRRST